VIKYLGSKRSMMPQLTAIAAASGAKSALDLFTGTTRVAQMLKGLGMHTTAVDVASYSEVFAKTWIELDASSVQDNELDDAIAHLNALPPVDGFFTQEYCVKARYFQPKNGQRVDAAREAIERDYRSSWLYFPLLSALILAADRVDSTTGVQMAYLKDWARRSHAELTIQNPRLLPGVGSAIRGDALELAPLLPEVELAYLDPPYNQHRYFGNYHVWESLVRWDNPEGYGIANKRIDTRHSDNKSPFNSKTTMPAALAEVIAGLRCETLVLSYNNEAWLSRDELIELCAPKGHVVAFEVDSKRYVGSQIGIYNKSGDLVGKPSHQRNTEYLIMAGDKTRIRRMLNALK